ncbi:MAG TPA: hypothetical protein VFC14_01270 [Burkholderiales bacterium]|jgi:hypothetical protein|nr:hypothetical protein [Burkholderiales bacterium]
MKTQYGNVFTRLLWGGVSLNPFELAIVAKLLENLPTTLRFPLLGQMDQYNLVQREHDGRALNFYKKVRGKVTRDGLPPLPIKSGEVTLVKVAFNLNKEQTPFHATMTAVNQRFFCCSFSQDTRPLARMGISSIGRVTESWRSNVLSVAEQRAQEGRAEEPRASWRRR